MRSGLLANEGGIPPPARLDAPLQRSWIDGHEAEMEPVAACPFEVIEQGPGEVAPDGNPTLTRPRERPGYGRAGRRYAARRGSH